MKKELADYLNDEAAKLKARQRCRMTAIALLDDEDGISATGYEELQNLVAVFAPDSCTDIFAAVESANGRVYLPEDHGFVP